MPSRLNCYSTTSPGIIAFYYGMGTVSAYSTCCETD